MALDPETLPADAAVPKTTGQPACGKAFQGAKRSGSAFAGRPSAPPLWLEPLFPGMRVAVAVSGGADSVSLLRALVEANARSRLGLVLSVAHVHHGIRGEEADRDAAFVASLAEELGLRLHRKDVNTPAFAHGAGMGLEEAARTLRYSWFAELLASDPDSSRVDTIATAHTLDDQAETVLHKLIRGAWTEGLSGIHPVLKLLALVQPGAGSTQSRIGAAGAAVTSQASSRPAGRGARLLPGPGESTGGRIIRPFLGATREQILRWLKSIGQPWREDASNADLAYTRNRIRHQLLPQLASFNPRIAHQLAQVAAIAHDEEAYWQTEVERLLPRLLLSGRAVRGGGRASSTLPGERSLAMEVERLRALHPALVRRLLRAAAKELGASLDFEETARLLALIEGPASANPRREELTGELRAERTPRELRLLFSAKGGNDTQAGSATSAAVEIPVPGDGEAFGWRVSCSLSGVADPQPEQPPALLRAAQPGDRVQLRYSRGAPKRVKEVLERMGVPIEQRGAWPILVWRGEIVWMRGAVLEPTPISSLLKVAAEQR